MSWFYASVGCSSSVTIVTDYRVNCHRLLRQLSRTIATIVTKKDTHTTEWAVGVESRLQLRLCAFGQLFVCGTRKRGRTLLRESPPVLQRNKIVLPKRFLIIKATRCRGSSFTKSPCLRSTLRFHVRASIVLLRVERRAAEWRLMPRRFRTSFHYFFSKSCSSVSLFLLSMLSSLLRPAC